jgi:hypothetical protein
VTDKAYADNKRSLTPEETKTWDDLDTAQEKLRADIEKYEKDEERRARSVALQTELRSTPSSGSGSRPTPGDGGGSPPAAWQAPADWPSDLRRAINSAIQRNMVGATTRSLETYYGVFQSRFEGEAAFRSQFAELDAAKRTSVDRQAQAERLLRAVLHFVEEAQPERLARLHALRTLSQMTAAVMVTPAMAPRDFRLPEVWLAASFVQLAQVVLVSPAERLALRIHVLGLGFQWALRSMRRAAARPRWSRFDRAVADWCSLDRAHVQVSYDATAALPADKTPELIAR